MVLLPLASHGSLCTRCALRSRILCLRQCRSRATSYIYQTNVRSTRYTTHANFSRSDPFKSKIRYYAGDGTPSADRQTRFWREENSIVRKFIPKGSLKEWGLDPDSLAKKSRTTFRDTLISRLRAVKDEVRDAPLLEQLAQNSVEVDGKRPQGFNTLWKDFTHQILQGDEKSSTSKVNDETKSSPLTDLRWAWNVRGVNGLDDRIKYAFYGHVTNSRFSAGDIKNQKALADLRYPTEWFPATRALTRTIHLHVGPTNSGKTFQALQRLEQADKGVYAGPLRLLAHEVYSRMNAKGKPCYLITGEERRSAEGLDPDHYMSACTVEMVPLNKTLDVAVIDEIQMIGNAERGWAWTQALLGVKAKEVHLCGEERTVPLIQEICASIGETLEVHRYKRLSPLRVADKALDGDLRRLRKGDCIVSFSVMGIHALRRQIEKATGRKVATVYGSLPPETRAQQARLFNDPNNDYDFLVASDAVGMGLNLAIKRIIFEASSKFDGIQRSTLSIADIKQIGGRAGRFRTAAQAGEAPVSQQELAAAKNKIALSAEQSENADTVGLVTTLERFDFPIVKAAMDSEPETIHSAGLFPPAPVLERFASYFPPGTPFSYMLTRLHELSQMHKRFHLCGLRDQVWIADLIEPVEGLTVSDRNIFCSAPAAKADTDLWKDLMPAFARCVAAQTSCNIADVKELPLETLEAEASPSREYLRELERLHKGIVTYLWLSYRFQGIFNTRALAFHVKTLVEEKIEHVLGQFSFSETQRRKLAARREKEVIDLLLAQQSVQDDNEGTNKSCEDFPEADGESSRPILQSKVDRLHDQTSLTTGGDRFSSEEDISLEESDVDLQPAQVHTNQQHQDTPDYTRSTLAKVYKNTEDDRLQSHKTVDEKLYE